jgi:aromatic-L-amino-acid/L-tryptophan decarboxylase
MDTELMRDLGYQIVDRIVAEFSNPTSRPVFPPPQTREAMEGAFGGPLPTHPSSPEDLFALVMDRVLPAAGNPNHPASMGYVITSSTPLPALFEALVAAIKLRPTTWKNQPASCHIETTVVRWLGEMVGFAANAAGYITTGGSWANLAALSVARVRRAGWDVRTEGQSNRPQLTAYASEHTHSCIQRSCEMLGIGSRWLRKIPVDSGFRIRLDLLEQAIETDLAAGHKPFFVAANAGTVETGAVDPLDALADLAASRNLWFHVDGAYGAFAALVPEKKSLLAGIARADSLTLDPHKWLNTPFEAGCILFRCWSDLRDTFSLIPGYLQACMGTEHNQYEYGFELSRTDRALKVWLALREHGTDFYANLIAEHIALARRLAELVKADPDFELMAEPELSICCFRFVPRNLPESAAQNEYLDTLNYNLELALMLDGRGLVSGTYLNGRRVLRACIASRSATKAGMEDVFRLLRELGRQLHPPPA